MMMMMMMMMMTTTTTTTTTIYCQLQAAKYFGLIRIQSYDHCS
jgi:hypothetical protein